MMKAKLTVAGSQTPVVKVRNTLERFNKAAKTRTITHHQLFRAPVPGLEHVAAASPEEGGVFLSKERRRSAVFDNTWVVLS